MTKDKISLAIENYNSIFRFEKLNTNLVVCEQPLISLKCLSLDDAEICAYLIIQKIKSNSVNYDEIQWHWKEINGEYIFFVLPDTNEKLELQRVVGKCPEKKYQNLNSTDPNNYVRLIDEIQLYRSCMMEGSKENHSCPFETDLLLAINKSERNLEDLNLLSQILCCLDMNLTLSFLDAMNSELVKRGSKVEQKDMLKGIEKFVDGIEEVCEEVSLILDQSCDGDAKGCRLAKVIETCEITADIFRRKRQMKTEPVNLSSIYPDENMPNAKFRTFFENTKEWDRDKKVRRRSCNSVLKSMRKMV